MFKIWLALFLAIFSTSSFAVGITIATAVFAGTALAGTIAVTAIGFAINMIVSVVLTKAFANNPSFDNGISGGSPDPGNRQQVPPATDNKLPVVYGSAYVWWYCY